MCETAKTASNTPKTSVPISTRRIVGFWLLQASHSAESNEPIPDAAERKPKPVAPHMQHVCGEEWQHDVEVRAEEQNQANHEDHQQHRRRFPDIVHALAQALPGALPLARVGVSRRLGVQFVTLDQRQAHKHREKAERIEQKEHGDSSWRQ